MFGPLGAHIPEDLDPDFEGEVEWGVNGREPTYARNHCCGNFDLALAHAAVSAGRSLPHKKLVTALCPFEKLPRATYLAEVPYPSVSASTARAWAARLRGPAEERGRPRPHQGRRSRKHGLRGDVGPSSGLCLWSVPRGWTLGGSFAQRDRFD